MVANDVRNLLALCRVCHDETEHAETWDATQSLGWRVPSHGNPFVTPALLYTVNGRGWWLLTEDAGYRWVDRGLDWRIDWGVTSTGPHA